jgi:hypothetical protein
VLLVREQLNLVAYPIWILQPLRNLGNQSCLVGQDVQIVFPKPEEKETPSAIPWGEEIQVLVKVARTCCIN